MSLGSYQYITPRNLLNSVRRFSSGYKIIEGCWEWQRSITNSGYAKFSVAKDPAGGLARFASGHRYSYELFYGPIPKGLVVDHLCRNKRCVNPKHLEAVTPGENSRRGVIANGVKSHCIHGHKFTQNNTYYRKSGKAGRNCRTCAAANQQRVRDAIAA